MVNISNYLRANWIPLVIVGLCAAFALVERYQRRIYEHIQPRLHPRAQPQLRGEALSGLLYRVPEHVSPLGPRGVIVPNVRIA